MRLSLVLATPDLDDFPQRLLGGDRIMAENLSELAIGIIDHIDGIRSLQELLRLCQEEMDGQDEKSRLRVGLLLDSYVARTDYHLDELKWRINELKPTFLKLKQLIGMAQPDE